MNQKINTSSKSWRNMFLIMGLSVAISACGVCEYDCGSGGGGGGYDDGWGGGGWGDNNDNNNDNNNGGWGDNNDNNNGGWGGDNNNNNGGWGGNNDNNNNGGGGDNDNNGGVPFGNSVTAKAKKQSCVTLEDCIQGAKGYKMPKNYLGGYGQSVGGSSKDVDQQHAEVQKQKIELRARKVASKFQMNVGKAEQITRLADKVAQMTANGDLSAKDRAAVTDSALRIAGLNANDLNATIERVVNHKDQAAIDDLMNKAATNLGMSSSAGLREQLLPALGLQF